MHAQEVVARAQVGVASAPRRESGDLCVSLGGIHMCAQEVFACVPKWERTPRRDTCVRPVSTRMRTLRKDSRVRPGWSRASTQEECTRLGENAGI